MARLRKMLGNPEDPSIVALMKLIETQSKVTLATWAVGYAEKNYLGIYEKVYTEDLRFHALIEAVKGCLEGRKTQKEVKPFLKAANQAAKEAEKNPAAQAAARALATACAVIQSPASSLGFTFYGAAAVAYDQAGVSESQTVYDALADRELNKILESLKEEAVLEEEHPVKINWYC